MRKGRWSKRGMEKSLYLLEIHAVLFIDEVGLGFPKRFGIFREKKKKKRKEFQLWLLGFWTPLVSKRMQVRSLASLSGLKIQCCRELCLKTWLRSLVAVV